MTWCGAVSNKQGLFYLIQEMSGDTPMLCKLGVALVYPLHQQKMGSF